LGNARGQELTRVPTVPFFLLFLFFFREGIDGIPTVPFPPPKLYTLLPTPYNSTRNPIVFAFTGFGYVMEQMRMAKYEGSPENDEVSLSPSLSLLSLHTRAHTLMKSLSFHAYQVRRVTGNCCHMRSLSPHIHVREND